MACLQVFVRIVDELENRSIVCSIGSGICEDLHLIICFGTYLESKRARRLIKGCRYQGRGGRAATLELAGPLQSLSAAHLTSQLCLNCCLRRCDCLPYEH